MEQVKDYRKAQIIEFIDSYIKENGFPPSVREIGKGIGLSSTATVQWYLKMLEEDGTLKRNPKSPRAMRILRVPEIGGAGQLC